MKGTHEKGCGVIGCPPLRVQLIDVEWVLTGCGLGVEGLLQGLLVVINGVISDNAVANYWVTFVAVEYESVHLGKLISL